MIIDCWVVVYFVAVHLLDCMPFDILMLKKVSVNATYRGHGVFRRNCLIVWAFMSKSSLRAVRDSSCDEHVIVIASSQ